MKRIYHIHGGTFRNYGDMAIKYAMQTQLNLQSSEPLQFIDIDLKHQQPITEELVDVMNSNGDMLLVGGGGLVMPGDGFKTRSGWQFNIDVADLHKLKIPFVIYGAGYNLFPGETLSDLAKTHLLATESMAVLFLCRDEASKKALVTEAGFEPHNINVMPDPAILTPSIPVNLPGVAENEFLIGVSLAGDRLEQRFESTEEWNTFVDVFCHNLKNTCEFFNGRVVFIPHIASYDIEPESFFKKKLPENMFYSLAENMPWLYPESLQFVPVLAGVYKKLRLCIGMRGHSLIIPYGQGVPVVGVNTHDKVGMFCESIGASVCEKDLSGLQGAISACRTKDANGESRKNMNLRFRREIEAVNNSILKILGVAPTTAPFV